VSSTLTSGTFAWQSKILGLCTYKKTAVSHLTPQSSYEEYNVSSSPLHEALKLLVSIVTNFDVFPLSYCMSTFQCPCHFCLLFYPYNSFDELNIAASMPERRSGACIQVHIARIFVFRGVQMRPSNFFGVAK